MALTRSFKHTIVARVKRDPAFANALLDEAATLFLNGEPHTARLILRDLVNSTVGFEGLAAATGKAARALPEKNESSGIPLRERIGFKNRTGRQASMRWGSRIQRICVSG